MMNTNGNKANEYEIVNVEDMKEKLIKSNATNLLGHRVELKWTSGKWYRGTVCKYDESKKRHYIVYDDGDERWYCLNEMVFRFVKEEDEWIEIKEQDLYPKKRGIEV